MQYGHHHERIDAIYTTIPRVTISGGFDLGSTTNYNPVTNHVVSFNNNLTWTLAGTRTGEHVLKMGAQVKFLRSDSFFDSNFRGTPCAISPTTRGCVATTSRPRPRRSST